MELMARSDALTKDDLSAIAAELGLGETDAVESAERAQARVDADERSARASGVRFTPTFFINGRACSWRSSSRPGRRRTCVH